MEHGVRNEKYFVDIGEYAASNVERRTRAYKNRRIDDGQEKATGYSSAVRSLTPTWYALANRWTTAGLFSPSTTLNMFIRMFYAPPAIMRFAYRIRM